VQGQYGHRHCQQRFVPIAHVHVACNTWAQLGQPPVHARIQTEKGFTSSNAIELWGALGQLSSFTADVGILFFGVQSRAGLACKPQQRIVGFTPNVACEGGGGLGAV